MILHQNATVVASRREDGSVSTTTTADVKPTETVVTTVLTPGSAASPGSVGHGRRTSFSSGLLVGSTAGHPSFSLSDFSTKKAPQGAFLLGRIRQDLT